MPRITKANSPPGASNAATSQRCPSGAPKGPASTRSASSFSSNRPPVSASTKSGRANSKDKLIDMPMAIKNRPSSKPLNGSRSASRAWRYSDFASTTPARKAPNAIDRPARCINTAMTTTISRATAVNSSRMSVRAMRRNTGPATNKPIVRIPTMTASPKPTETWLSVPPWPNSEGRAISGMAAISSETAKSQKSVGRSGSRIGYARSRSVPR